MIVNGREEEKKIEGIFLDIGIRDFNELTH